MLSAEEKQEIDRELAHSPTRQAACIEGMKIIQRHRGWVSDESIRDLAEHLQMSAEDLDGVATFYNVMDASHFCRFSVSEPATGHRPSWSTGTSTWM